MRYEPLRVGRGAIETVQCQVDNIGGWELQKDIGGKGGFKERDAGI